MGSGSSKAVGSAAKAAANSTSRRVYPTRATGTTPTSASQINASQSPPVSTNVSSSTNPSSRSAPEESVGPHVHPQTRATDTRTDAINLDARDPDFASRLSQLGPVRHPAPTFSPSSTASSTSHFTSGNQKMDPSSSYPSGPSSDSSSGGIFPDPAKNPAIAILTARQRIADEVEAEKLAQGRKGWQGRRYADVATLRKALVLRDEQGMPDADIERFLGLRAGSVAALGGVGTVEAV